MNLTSVVLILICCLTLSIVSTALSFQFRAAYLSCYISLVAILNVVCLFYFTLLQTLGLIEVLTISKQHEDGQIHSSFPAWVFLDGDAVACGSEHFAAPNGDQLAALISARHVI